DDRHHGQCQRQIEGHDEDERSRDREERNEERLEFGSVSSSFDRDGRYPPKAKKSAEDDNGERQGKLGEQEAVGRDFRNGRSKHDARIERANVFPDMTKP